MKKILLLGPALFAFVLISLTILKYDFLLSLGWHPIKDPTFDWPSGLALGEYGIVMTLTFIISGLLMALLGLRLFLDLKPDSVSRAGSTLMMCAGLALAGLSFTTDPTIRDTPATWHGRLHDLSFVLLGITLMPSMLILGKAFRNDSHWQNLSLYSWLTAALALPTFFLKGAAFYVFLFAVLLWVEVVAWKINVSKYKELYMAGEYKFSEKEYLDLLELTYEAAQSIKGKISTDGRKPDSQYLALKLYVHSTTAYWLYKGTNAPVPVSTGGSTFIDFSSIAVLARAALETYFTFFEVFIAPSNEDQFEFNYCLWHLAGHVIRENIVPVDPSLSENYKIAQEEIKTLRNRISATAKFQELSDREKKAILKGVRKREWDTVAESAGFGYQFVRRIYAYDSGHVHADGLTSGQLMSAQTKDDQKYHSEMHLLTIMFVLSKFILNYGELFVEVRNLFSQYSETHKYAIMLSEIAKKME